MEDLAPHLIGNLWASSYDDYHPAVGATEPIIEALVELSQGGPVLELGVGTGRIALPLAKRGVEVHGVDVSEGMIDCLRTKTGGSDIPILMASFTDFQSSTKYPLIFVGFNTFFLLLTQAAQVQAFLNVAQHLLEGGLFVIDGMVPHTAPIWGASGIQIYSIDETSVLTGAVMHDPVRQRVDLQTIHFKGSVCELRPVQFRYAWPAELDLMAQLAGLCLRDRWEDWDKAPFSGRSPRHVTLYELRARSKPR